MERTLIICGSAGRGGVTETMCQTAADVIRSRGQDAMVVFPSEMRIEHCRGCDSCSEGPCVIEDDMHRLYRLFAESDFLMLATPLHFSGPSSLTKTVMDRFQTYWHGKDLPHPIAMAGMICSNEYFGSGFFFGRPMCDMRITEPPSESTFLTVGMAARMRVSSVTSPFSFRGTLKSTRMIARLPLKS